MPTVKQNQERVSREIDLRRSLLNKKPKQQIKSVPRWQYPHKSELFYKTQLLDIVDLINESLHSQLIPILPKLQLEISSQRPDLKNDDFIDNLNGTIDNMQIFVDKNQPQPDVLASTTGQDISLFNHEQMQKIMRHAFGVNVFSQEPWLTTQLDLFTQQNVDLIKDITDKALNNIKGIVARGFSSGNSLRDIQSDLEARIGFTKNRAKLIARDQTSKLNGQLTQLRQTENGIDSYVWATAGDERVRDTHAANEARTFRWDDPPATGNPGDEVNCRCTAIPVLKDLL